MGAVAAAEANEQPFEGDDQGGEFFEDGEVVGEDFPEPEEDAVLLGLLDVETGRGEHGLEAGEVEAGVDGVAEPGGVEGTAEADDGVVFDGFDEEEDAAGAQAAADFGEGLVGVADVVEDVLDVDEVAAMAGEGELEAAGDEDGAVLFGPGDALRGYVEADGGAAVLDEAAHVPAGGAAEVEDAADVGLGHDGFFGREVG